VALIYGRKIGLIGSFFLSINGLFIGLSRIVQYQAIVILFSILALYGFSLAVQSKRWRIAGIYTGFICWAIAILAHYDGIFIAPFAIYLLACWYAGEVQLSRGRRWVHIGLPALLFVLILLAFFIPFFSMLGEGTLEYWSTRISGDEIQAGIPSSVFTFNLYNPLLAIYLYAILAGLSLLRLRQTYPIWLWLAFPWLSLRRRSATRARISTPTCCRQRSWLHSERRSLKRCLAGCWARKRAIGRSLADWWWRWYF